MDFKVGVGKSDFADLRKSENYYVDKTEIMYELVHDTDNKVTLFTRPRRFGKTLMMSMMENFFSIRKDSREIFEGTVERDSNDWLSYKSRSGGRRGNGKPEDTKQRDCIDF